MSTPTPSNPALPDDHITITRPDPNATATAAADRPNSIALPTDAFPGYEVLHELNRGAQGIVYQAIQTGTQRKVALKILLEGPYASPAAKRRFEREVELVAQLKHPNIIAIFHSGQSTDGRHFYVMDYVRGMPLNQYVRERKLTLEETLKLFATVCEAVQYAHQRGIIHRDLKPSNILVDSDGIPRVLDFGLAKWLASSAETNVSLSAQVVGTLPYMSPEQARGNPDEIDTRTDVYALGVILYELLTGHYPYPVVGQIMEILRHITQTPATPPSKQWTSDSGVTKRSKGRLREGQCPIDDEVQTIVLKALSKEQDRRYQSAENLARDVLHYLAHEPIEAKRDSGWYVLKKTLRQYRVPVAIASAFLLLLAGSAVVSTILWRRAAAAKSEAQAQKALAEGSARAEKQRADELKQVSDFQQQMLSQIDATDAGVKLMKDIRERFAGALLKRGVSDKDRAEQVQALGDELSRVNATDTAVAMIDRTILKPAFSAVESQFRNQPVVNAALRQTLADIYRKLGRFDDAMPPQEQALTTRRRVLGTENLDTLTSINNMGSLLQDQGKLVEAETYYREALEKFRGVLGEEHPDTLTSIANMGELRHAQGKLAEAEPYVREALEKRRRVLGDEHPHTLSSINNMGYLLQAQGKLAEAEPYYREALQKLRRVLGDDHPDTLNSINNMGNLLRIQGKPAEAEPYFREALEKSRRVLGDEHPNTLRSINNMGFVLQSQGKLAEPYFREALDKRRRVLGDEHPDTLESISNMGYLLQAQGKLALAEPFFREALQRSRRVLGDEHPNTLTSIGNMGGMLQAQGKLAEAEPYVREALEKSRRVLGDEHPNTLGSINRMGFLLKTQGKLAEAEPYYREAVQKLRRVLGDEHPNTLSSINNMGNLLQAQGKQAEAEPYLREALEKRRRALGDDHPDTLRSINNMGNLLQAQGKPAEAEPYYREALDKRRRVLGDEHPDTLISINNMGYLLQVQGKPAEAEPYYRDALEKSRRVLGDDHPDTLNSIYNMGNLLRIQGKQGEAEPYYLGALAGYSKKLGRSRWETADCEAGLGFVLRDLSRYADAETHLLEAERVLRTTQGGPAGLYGRCVDGIIKLYDKWHAAEPGNGHDKKAADWRAQLAQWQASTQPATQPSTQPAAASTPNREKTATPP